MKRRMQMPDFAGTALVDILANGLAMLIIVIVPQHRRARRTRTTHRFAGRGSGNHYMLPIIELHRDFVREFYSGTIWNREQLPRRCADAVHDSTTNGVYDPAGNVSEWTLSVTAEPGDYAAWVQGGNWLLPGKTTARSVFGRLLPLTHRSDSIGFRVVYD